jgi:hypothetical protein
MTDLTHKMPTKTLRAVAEGMALAAQHRAQADELEAGLIATISELLTANGEPPLAYNLEADDLRES